MIYEGDNNYKITLDQTSSKQARTIKFSYFSKANYKNKQLLIDLPNTYFEYLVEQVRYI